MEIEKIESIIESILFAAGREVLGEELELALEIPEADIERIISKMMEDYKSANKGIELVKINNGYSLCTKNEYVYQVVDKRNKPRLSNAALETLSIIAYNPRISRAEIESIRGVSVDGTMYKLMEYGLIEEAGKLDLPGKPMSYKTTNEFLKMFGYSSLNDLPELPRYKLDENHQIVVDELIENDDTNNVENEETIEVEIKKVEKKDEKEEV